MTIPPVPPRTWARFCAPATSPPPAPTTKVDRYRIESIRAWSGAPVAGLAAGDAFVRLESTLELPAGGGDLVGVTQELRYTRAAERPDLVSRPFPVPDAVCVMIPLSKSEAWWQMSQDERDAMFRGATRPGHVETGLPYSRAIARKLYHCRALPGAGFDFLTYFEFAPADQPKFEALLAGLRDPKRNPEWTFVERETEIWLSRAPTTDLVP
jgi:hypothetical protein